jgi:hypothetical protein
MKIVKQETVCEFCGKRFMGDFIQHETPEDDFKWEKEMMQDAKELDEDSFYMKWEEDIENWKEQTYPHTHEQPTPECHICPSCREKAEKEREKHV